MWGFRDPRRTMLSDYYYERWQGKIHILVEKNFEEWAHWALEHWRKKTAGPYTWLSLLDLGFRPISVALYQYQIRNYLDQGFLPSQMVVYPGNLYVQYRDNLDTNPLLEALRKKIGKSLLRPPPVATTKKDKKHDNTGKHGTLEEELSAEVRAQLEEEIFVPEIKKLMELLAELIGQGLTLVGYSGEGNDVAAVTEYLSGAWVF
mmetsp:Transcript_16499/g.36030  ORF Transcript_16499/g.36030 Transcript_16499/m.36030 type:complete len:204 (+) Transcript_16499:76-687(+)